MLIPLKCKLISKSLRLNAWGGAVIEAGFKSMPVEPHILWKCMEITGDLGG